MANIELSPYEDQIRGFDSGAATSGSSLQSTTRRVRFATGSQSVTPEPAEPGHHDTNDHRRAFASTALLPPAADGSGWERYTPSPSQASSNMPPGSHLVFGQIALDPVAAPCNLSQTSSSIPSVDLDNISLKGIPKRSFVQECALREGFKDRGSSESKVPRNPFGSDFDNIWEHYYKRGKISGSAPNTRMNVPVGPPNSDQTWAPFIDPYTQSPEHPNGFTDPERTRTCCEAALEGMKRSIDIVNRPKGGWLMCIDVAKPILDALPDFPDLRKEYNRFKKEGEEALEGSISGQFR
ncbi:hypothetical protein IQ07DRAFT_677963 [Pyrenochaeta sp. DS3sAY3a]|nr:hypothetical protein IQ07DRAFT_677963 [Pyrenochaeta sp. DS3sAY3a]